MATTAGNEATFEGLITDLILLERDAIALCISTIERLSQASLGAQVAEFRQDHLQHLDTLQEMARQAGADAPAERDAKQMLTTGKIALADLIGHGAELKAMKTSKDDTVTAYERAAGRDAAGTESRAFFEKALADGRRHRDWMQGTAQAL